MRKTIRPVQKMEQKRAATKEARENHSISMSAMGDFSPTRAVAI